MIAGLSQSREKRGPMSWSPCPRLLLLSKASGYIAGCKRVHQAGKHNFHIVTDNYTIDQGSTYISYKDELLKIALLPRQATLACQFIVGLVQAKNGIPNTTAAFRV